MAKQSSDGLCDVPNNGPNVIGPRPAWTIENGDVENTPQLHIPAQYDGRDLISLNTEVDTSSAVPKLS